MRKNELLDERVLVESAGAMLGRRSANRLATPYDERDRCPSLPARSATVSHRQRTGGDACVRGPDDGERLASLGAGAVELAGLGAGSCQASEIQTAVAYEAARPGP